MSGSNETCNDNKADCFEEEFFLLLLLLLLLSWLTTEKILPLTSKLGLLVRAKLIRAIHSSKIGWVSNFLRKLTGKRKKIKISEQHKNTILSSVFIYLSHIAFKLRPSE
jgi:hypothetical protein